VFEPAPLSREGLLAPEPRERLIWWGSGPRERLLWRESGPGWFWRESGPSQDAEKPVESSFSGKCCFGAKGRVYLAGGVFEKRLCRVVFGAYVLNTRSDGHKSGIRLTSSLFCGYSNLEYVLIYVICRATQAECVIHILVTAPQEYVDTHSARRVRRDGLQRVWAARTFDVFRKRLVGQRRLLPAKDKQHARGRRWPLPDIRVNPLTTGLLLYPSTSME